MNSLSLVIENIILDYKIQMEQIEHKLKFQKTLDEINKVIHCCNHRESYRTYRNKMVNCYGGLNCANLMRDSVHELWVHGFTKINDVESELVNIIFEDKDGIFFETVSN